MIEIQTSNISRRGKQKLLLILVVATFVTALEHYVAASILLILFLITLAEVTFLKKETFFTRKIESALAYSLMLLARVIVATIYVLLILPMSFFGSKRIESALSASISMEGDPRLEGCLCELVPERGF